MKFWPVLISPHGLKNFIVSLTLPTDSCSTHVQISSTRYEISHFLWSLLMKNNKHTFCWIYSTRLPHSSLLVCDQFYRILSYLFQFDSIVSEKNWWDWLRCQVATSASLESIPWCIHVLHRPHANSAELGWLRASRMPKLLQGVQTVIYTMEHKHVLHLPVSAKICSHGANHVFGITVYIHAWRRKLRMAPNLTDLHGLCARVPCRPYRDQKRRVILPIEFLACTSDWFARARGIRALFFNQTILHLLWHLGSMCLHSFNHGWGKQPSLQKLLWSKWRPRVVRSKDWLIEAFAKAGLFPAKSEGKKHRLVVDGSFFRRIDWENPRHSPRLWCNAWRRFCQSFCLSISGRTCLSKRSYQFSWEHCHPSEQGEATWLSNKYVARSN